MRLVLHIVGKDFRRLRWPLGGWLAVVAARLGIGFSLVMSGGFLGMADNRLQALTTALLVLGLLLTFVLTAMLVQEDSLVGATQFWPTRPISGARLLGAKTVGWLLLLWLPAVVVTLPWWLTCAFGPREIALAVLELLLLHAAVSLPAAMVAVVTDTLSRFLIWSFVFLFSMTAIPGVMAYAMSSRMGDASLPWFVIGGWATFVLTLVAVIVRQFLTRNVVRSLMWLGVGVVISPLVAIMFASGSARIAGTGLKWTESHPEQGSGITLSVHSFDETFTSNAGDASVLMTLFEVKGLPRDLALDGGVSAKQTWRWPGGPVVTRGAAYVEAGAEALGVRAALGLADVKPDEETEKYFADRHAALIAKWRAAHPGKTEGPPPPQVAARVFAEVFPSTIKRIERTPPAYEASVPLRLLRPELWLEVPLKNNGWHARSAHGFRLGQPVPFEPQEIATSQASDSVIAYQAMVPLCTTMPKFFWDALSYSYSWLIDDWRGVGLYFINRASGNVERKFVRTEPSLTIGSVEIKLLSVPTWQPGVRRGEKWVVRDPKWLSGVSAALVGFREEARFTVEVKSDRYEAAK